MPARAAAGRAALTQPATLELPPPIREIAREVFGPRFALAVRYAEHLGSVGAARGVIGPRETARLWERHLLNCAVVADLVPTDARLLDVGSGAGLPGIPLALARPDLRVTLLDSMLRRTTYLTEVIREIGLSGVDVVRVRAESHRARYDVVTARAVAALPTLGVWTSHLVGKGGVLLALRGEQADAELGEGERALAAAGWHEARVHACGMGLGQPTRVVRAVRR